MEVQTNLDNTDYKKYKKHTKQQRTSTPDQEYKLPRLKALELTPIKPRKYKVFNTDGSLKSKKKLSNVS